MNLFILLLTLVSGLAYANSDCSLQKYERCLPGTAVKVLIYHHVTDSLPAGNTVIGPKELVSHMDMIRRLGYTTITISELTEFMQGRIELPEKTVAITFDDGWKNNIVAAQILAERNMSATFYILSGKFDDPQYLSEDDLIWISRQRKFEIGAHSHTHFMQWDGRMQELDDRIMVGEMMMSKAILEGVIGKPVNSFSWPFGYFRNNILDMAPTMGFTSTVHVNGKTKNTANQSAMHISRINISGVCNSTDLAQMLESSSVIENCK